MSRTVRCRTTSEPRESCCSAIPSRSGRSLVPPSGWETSCSYIQFVIGELVLRSKAGKVDTCALFFVLALDRFGFVANNILQKIGEI